MWCSVRSGSYKGRWLHEKLSGNDCEAEFSKWRRILLNFALTSILLAHKDLSGVLILTVSCKSDRVVSWNVQCYFLIVCLQKSLCLINSWKTNDHRKDKVYCFENVRVIFCNKQQYKNCLQPTLHPYPSNVKTMVDTHLDSKLCIIIVPVKIVLYQEHMKIWSLSRFLISSYMIPPGP